MAENKTTDETESANPGDDQRAFRRCLAQFATGVNIITTETGGVKAGVTANSFSSLSLEPPLVLWSLGRNSRSFDAFMAAEKFAINILSMDQVDVSQQFASTAEDKFEGVNWRTGKGGMPLIDGAIGALECKTFVKHDGGDHVLFIGEVEYFTRRDGEPLIFAQGRYGVAAEHPGALKRVQPETPREIADLPTITRLVFYAHRALSFAFDENRKQENVTLAQHKILTSLYGRESLTAKMIAEQMFLGLRDATDAIDELVSRGLVTKVADGGFRLTAEGESCRILLGKKLIEFEDELMSGFSRSEVEIFRSVLNKIIGNKK